MTWEESVREVLERLAMEVGKQVTDWYSTRGNA